MTATRDRRSDPETDAGPAWDDRPIIGQFRGLPWWGAVLLAFGLSAVAAVVDMQRQNSLGKIYQVAFILGCLAAICLVRRRSLFGPMVQPPLVFAITAIGAVALLSQKAPGGGLKALVLSVAWPLTSNFPTMGGTTAVVVAIGLWRWWRERDPDPDVRPSRPAKERGGLDDEPGQSSGGRGLRERAAADQPDRAAVPPRRGRPEPDEAAPAEARGRRMPGRGSRPSREPVERESARDSGSQPRRREPGPGRAERAERVERGRAEPPAERGRGRGRGAEPPAPRRREPGAEGGRSREERGRRDTGREGGRDGGREGRGGTSGRQPRRRPPDSQR